MGGVLAAAESQAGDLVGAERDYREALRMWKAIGVMEGVVLGTGNLAGLALEREDWAAAETLAREALALGEELGRKDRIASNCACLAEALTRQNRKPEALAYAQRAVNILTQRRSPELDEARGILRECQER